MTAPRIGDRIRVEAVHEGVLTAPDVLTREDGKTVQFGRLGVTVTVLVPAEQRQIGDVVFAAEANELWVVIGWLEDAPRWFTVDLRTGDTSRGGAPPPGAVLKLRGGKRVVLPEPTDEDLNAADLAAALGSDGADGYGRVRAIVDLIDERRGVIRP
jgi:hypothetical protein